MLSEDVPVPRYNGPILTIAKIIKCVMSSAAEYELAGLYICAKEMVPLRQSLVKMGWPQPRSPIQCDNSTAIGVANEKIIPRKTKSMDIFFTGCVEEILKASSGTSGHLSSTIWVTTAPRTISQSTTSPNGRSGRLHFTTLDWLQFKFYIFCSQCSLQGFVDPQVSHLWPQYQWTCARVPYFVRVRVKPFRNGWLSSWRKLDHLHYSKLP